MHLVIINQYGLPAGAAGITRHGDLGAELVRRGHGVTVIASRFHYLTREAGGPDRPEIEVRTGVSFRWLDTGAYRRNDRQRLRSMLSFTVRATWAGLRLRDRPTVVMASSPHLLVGLSGLVLAWRYRVPLVFEVRDLWPSALVDLGSIRSGGVAHRALELVERICYRTAARIITVPPHGDRRVRQMGGDVGRCVHIPNASTLDLDESAPLPGTLEAMLRACGSREIVLYAGAQGVSNGLEVVLYAMDRLRDTDRSTYDRLAVILLGDGGSHEELVRTATERGHEQLHFHPPIAKAAVSSALRRASALLVSFADAPVYDYGLSPNKLFDYLAVGRPVLLASRLTDTPVDEADAGRRYEPGSATSLATAIADLLALPIEERERMGARGRELVRRRYTIGVTGGILERTLIELRESHR